MADHRVLPIPGKPDAGPAPATRPACRRSISRAARAGKGLPPVERWNPDFCGDLDMEIRADGTWFYLGTPIGRMPLVQLFSTVLRKDADGKTYLVTPVEKVGIRVVDAPFVAVEMNVRARATSRSSPSAPMSATWWRPAPTIRCASSTRTAQAG